MKPVEVTDERLAQWLEENEQWRKEHPVRRRLVDALGRLRGWLQFLRNALRWSQFKAPYEGPFFLHAFLERRLSGGLFA